MGTQRYMSTDGFFQIQHKVPERSTAEEREACLPEKFVYYVLYCLNKDGSKYGETEKITFARHKKWLLESSTSELTILKD